MQRFPYQTCPFGWYPILFSDELQPGETKPLFLFEQELIAWRGKDDGKAHVFDANCPHMGANFNYGARVEDDCLRCPFHGFTYDTEGRCVFVPYSTRPNPKAVAERLAVRELNGQVYAWYHPLQAPPMWEVPIVEEWLSDKYTKYEQRHEWRIATAWHEIAEQIVDVGHTLPLHGFDLPHYDSLNVEGHVFQAGVSQSGDAAGHSSEQDGTSITMGGAGDSLVSTYYGPGMAVIRYSGPLTACIVSTTIPITPSETLFRWGLMGLKGGSDEETQLMNELVLQGFVSILEQDIPIWEHKRWIERPPLVSEDGDIPKFRRWAGQFHIDAPQKKDRQSEAAAITTPRTTRTTSLA